ncbi:cell division protein [Caulobacter sp. UNC279MFTsu5.1]|uniref:cell division protein FtsL n=1 Tax=Caulobacter sp. UNC279MFTsu5.1 TaxID=1502775 RepID=UPI0008E20633|nr:cell division protein [Caulobacter sp. UNC279MFTsu5.1]SFJ90562.1 cell division protein FtsL [Caulobacter sp. UNC279MFTsu5.1]
MSLSSIFDRRVRGFRVVELVCLTVLLVLVLGVYMAKTFAGRERAEIASVERQIEDEKLRVRLLKAEVAYLEQPRRIEQLAQQLQLAPIKPEHETTEDALIDVARHAPAAHAPASPTAAANTDAAAAEAPESTPDDYPSPEQASGEAPR